MNACTLLVVLVATLIIGSLIDNASDGDDDDYWHGGY